MAMCHSNLSEGKVKDVKQLVLENASLLINKASADRHSFKTNNVKLNPFRGRGIVYPLDRSKLLSVSPLELTILLQNIANIQLKLGFIPTVSMFFIKSSQVIGQ